MRYLLLAGLACIGCSDEPCLNLPCNEPLALEVSITSASGGPVVATVAVTSPVVTTFSCSATCPVSGPSGKYEFDVTAPGFAPVHKSVQVQGTQRKCGCEIVETQTVQVALVPTP
jgi:hypothetical protein